MTQALNTEIITPAAITTDITTVEKIRRLPWSIATDTFNIAFLQLTFIGSVFVLFLNQLGLGKGQVGVLLSLLPFAGIVGLFVAPWVARVGYKRSTLIFLGARSTIAATLLLLPWVLARFGNQATLGYIMAVVGIFAIVRAIGLTAYFPWVKEVVPDSMRGKYTAMNQAVTASVGFIAIVGARFVLEGSEGITGFMLLLGVGVGLGLLAVATASRIPGGAPAPVAAGDAPTRRDLKAALQDRNFLYYLAGMGLDVIALAPLLGFLPLFMQEKVGLSAGNVVLLQAGALVGGLLSSYLWGWLADRYGSKPILLAGLLLTILLPVGWLLIPRQHEWSLMVALGVAFVEGIATLGWNTGTTRLLYVDVVPPAHKTDYLALQAAWVGVVAGIGQLVGGWVLARAAPVEAQWWIFTIDAYFPLFVAGSLLPLLGFFFLRRVRTNDAISPGEFVGLFTRGNALTAVEGLIGFHRAKDEQTAVAMTKRLGEADSLLAADELIAALADPRFWVRFEALIAMANMQPDERLRTALVDVLGGDDAVLSVVAAWALGRMGDQGALQPLRVSLEAEDDAVKEYSARALGLLEDRRSAPLLLRRLQSEQAPKLQIAYAAALGQLRVKEAIPPLLTLLRTVEEEGARNEVALALARIMGQEHEFIQLVRQVNQDAATATAQTLLNLKTRVNGVLNSHDGLGAAIEACADTLSREQLTEGVELIRCLIGKLPQQQLDAHRYTVLLDCVESLEKFGSARMEYVVLTLHAMNGEWQPLAATT